MRYLNNKGRITSQDIESELVNEDCIVFEVTEACNFKCEYCIFGDLYSNFHHSLNRRMTFETAKAVIDYMVELWTRSYSKAYLPITTFGFYGGEPLLNFELIQRIVEYIKGLNLNRSIRFNMTSNCYLLDKCMDFLAQNKFDLLISLDGDENGDSYRKLHDGSPSFQKVFKNIKELQRKYPDYFRQ